MTSPRFRRDAVRYYNTEDGLRLIENGVYGFIVLRNTERTRGELGHSQRFYILSGADTPGGRFPGKPEWIEALAALPGSRWSGAHRRWRVTLTPPYGGRRDQRGYVDRINRQLAPVLTAAIQYHHLDLQERRRRFLDARAAALTAAAADPVTDD